LAKIFHIIFILLVLCSSAYAQEYAELRTETAEELLLFFEEEELIIATRRPTPVRKAPATATVITAKEIRNMGARNLIDVLKMVPGFGVSITEYGVQMFEVRGIRTPTSEKILLMIDGHSLNKSFTGSALYTLAQDMPVENIKKIEVIRGPGSALYGANAFVAVINVITRDPDGIDGIEVKGGYGSFDTSHANITAGKSFENGLDLSGSADYFRTDGDDIRIERDTLTGTPFTTTPGDAFIALEKTDLFLKASYGDFTFRGHYIKRDDEGFYVGLAYSLTDDSTNPIEYYWGELSYHPVINSKLSAEFKLYYDHYEQETSAQLQPEGFAGSFPDGMIGEPWLKDRTIGGEAQFNYNITDSNHLIAGMMYEKMRQYDVHQYANFAPTLFPPVPVDLGAVQEVANWNKDADRELMAVYLQDEWEIVDNLNLTAGIRYDHYSDFGDTTNPRVGVVWGFMENADLKLLYGQAFRAPNFVELYNQNNPVNQGNPDLDPETIKTYEASLGLRLAHSFSVDMNYFYNKIEDIIVWDTTTSPALHVNAGEAEVQGIELVLTGQYTQDNYWKVSYTYQDPKDSATDERLPYVPLHRAGASINYGLTKHLNIHTDILWTDERSRPAGDTRDDVDSYTTVDLALTLKNFYRTLEIQGTVHNLFDENYKDPDTSGASQLVPDDFPREGTSVMLSVSYKF
jgi:iron complex outermembrane receptor protein